MLQDFVHLFFPHYCLTCPQVLVQGETLLCASCFYELPLTNSHVTLDNLVAQKLHGRIPISHAMALYKFRKMSKVQQLLHQLKYKRQPIIGRLLGKKYGTMLKEAGLSTTFDLIVPVPLHASKLRQRGYNQSDFFAQGLAEAMAVPWASHGVRRVKHTPTQTHKSKLERLENVADAFQVTHSQVVCDQRLLLVDDIITTGATIEACGLALLAAGAKAINVATIAVTE
ncbi:MAG: phosphoribosyltransferase family protein [Roseivirga sp.]